MENLFFFASPLEQFEILALYPISLGFVSIYLTNQLCVLIIVCFFLFFYFSKNLQKSSKTMFVVPHRWQVINEILYLTVLNMVISNIAGKKNQFFFPLIFSIFFFILSLNLVGLIPYSFAVTSHIVVTLTLSLAVFIGINIVCITTHKSHFFALFLPSGTSAVLAFILVPIEFVSYIFKPLSLAVRLFCNIMAGHTLLKVFAGFAWSLMDFTGILFLVYYVPLVILFLLFGLELIVAIIQAFIFSLLTCIYLNDALNLH